MYNDINIQTEQLHVVGNKFLYNLTRTISGDIFDFPISIKNSPTVPILEPSEFSLPEHIPLPDSPLYPINHPPIFRCK